MHIVTCFIDYVEECVFFVTLCNHRQLKWQLSHITRITLYSAHDVTASGYL